MTTIVLSYASVDKRPAARPYIFLWIFSELFDRIIISGEQHYTKQVRQFNLKLKFKNRKRCTIGFKKSNNHELQVLYYTFPKGKVKRMLLVASCKLCLKNTGLFNIKYLHVRVTWK